MATWTAPAAEIARKYFPVLPENESEGPHSTWAEAVQALTSRPWEVAHLERLASDLAVHGQVRAIAVWDGDCGGCEHCESCACEVCDCLVCEPETCECGACPCPTSGDPFCSYPVVTDGLHRMVLALSNNAEVLLTDLQDEDEDAAADQGPRSRTLMTLRGLPDVTGISHLFSHRLDASTWVESRSISGFGHAGEWTLTVNWPIDLTDRSDVVHAHLTTVASQLGADLSSLDTEIVPESGPTSLSWGEELDEAEDDADEGGFDPKVAGLLPQLVADPAFDPIVYDEEMEEFVRARVDSQDDAFIADVILELFNYATYSGLHEAAEQLLRKEARRILKAMPPAVRDRYGFASKNAVKEEILDRFLPDVHGLRRGRLQSHVGWAESEVYTAHREERYATAARRLLSRGMTKKAAAEALGLSTGVMDRLLRTRPEDVDITGNDPLSQVLES